MIFGGILIYETFIYEEPKIGAVLEVEEVYFVYKGETEGESRVSVTVFISNVGDEKCNVRLRAFAIDDRSNIAMDDAESDIGVIQAEKTEETSFEMSVLYNGTFTVELMIFKDDLITVKGSGTVSLSIDKSGGRDYRNTMEDEKVDQEKGSDLPFPAMGIVILTLLAAGIVFGKFRKRRCSG